MWGDRSWSEEPVSSSSNYSIIIYCLNIMFNKYPEPEEELIDDGYILST